MVSLQPLPYIQNGAHWFARVRKLGMPVWLDSAWPYSRRGRYDIISAAPLEVVRNDTEGNPFAHIRARLAEQLPALPNRPKLPFTGGAIGVFGYELGRRLQGLPQRASVEPRYITSVGAR